MTMWGWIVAGVIVAAVAACIVGLGVYFITHPLIK